MQAHIDQYMHEFLATLQKIMPLPFGVEQTAGSLSTACPLAQDLASQAYVEHVFSVCEWLTASRRNRLSKNLMCL